MTHQELAKAMAAVVKDYVRVDRAGLETRLAGAETNLAALQARVQDDSFTKELGTLRERVAIVEVRPSPGPPVDHLTPEDLTAQAADFCRKALGDVIVPVRPMQKRIIRDGQGRIDRVVEEPV